MMSLPPANGWALRIAHGDPVLVSAGVHGEAEPPGMDPDRREPTGPGLARIDRGHVDVSVAAGWYAVRVDDRSASSSRDPRHAPLS